MALSKPNRKPFAQLPTRQRSAVTNGARLFVNGNGRGPWARRYFDLLSLFADDAGGMENLTELRLSLCRRAASLCIESERLESELADGKPVDIDQLARISSHLRRIAESIGLNRVKRDVTPTLDALVAKHSAAPQRAPLARESNARAANEPRYTETHVRASQPSYNRKPQS